jgi:hypothetical protein
MGDEGSIVEDRRNLHRQERWRGGPPRNGTHERRPVSRSAQRRGPLPHDKRSRLGSSELGRVDIHRMAIADPTRWIIALWLASVFWWRIAILRNSLILRKKFSVGRRHLYISKWQSMGSFRLALGGMTAMAPRRLSSVRSQSLSKALSASRADGRSPVSRRRREQPVADRADDQETGRSIRPAACLL